MRQPRPPRRAPRPRAIGTPVTENAVPAKARAAAGATSRCCVWQRRISSCRISFLRAFSICANGINVSVGIAPRLIHEFCKQFGPPSGVRDAALSPVFRHHNWTLITRSGFPICFHCSAHCFFHCSSLFLRGRLFFRLIKVLHCNWRQFSIVDRLYFCRTTLPSRRRRRKIPGEAALRAEQPGRALPHAEALRRCRATASSGRWTFTSETSVPTRSRTSRHR